MAFKDIFNIFKKQVQYVYGWQYGTPNWSSQNDEAYIREAYNKIVWVYSCVSMIASCCASVPWVLYRNQRGNKVEIEEHPILTMLNTRVASYMTSKDFFDLWATYLALQGKFYAEYNNSAMPTQIYPMYPHLVKPIPDRKMFVSGFEYSIGSDTTIYKADSVLWSKFNDPMDLYQGLSPVRALARTIDTENQSVDWNKNTLQNSAVPAGAISVVNPSPELTQKLREDWLSRYGGSNNARVPLVLNAEKASYVSFGLSPIDMDFLNQRKLNRIEICSAFGVPSQVVGDPEGQTYANYSEAVKAFWYNTVIPRYLELMKDKINSEICTKYADNLSVDYSLDNVSALHESVDDISARVTVLFEKNIITQNEGRIALGYEEIPDGDVFAFELSGKMFNSAMGNKLPANEEVVTENEPQQDEAVGNNDDGTQKKTGIIDTESLYIKAENRRDPYYKFMESKVNELFAKELKLVKGILNNSMTPQQATSAVNKIINSNKKNWQKVFFAYYQTTIKAFGDDTMRELNRKKALKADEFNVYDEAVGYYIDETTGERITNISDTTKDDVKSLTAKGVEEGWSIPAFKKSLDNMYLNTYKNRARTIAVTETVSASNYGSFASAQQSGLDIKKAWIASLGSRTRDSHARANGQIKKMDDYFIVNGYRMLFPGDASMGAPAKEIINCRCTIGYRE